MGGEKWYPPDEGGGGGRGDKYLFRSDIGGEVAGYGDMVDRYEGV